jgi:hypothetical protein
MKFDFYKTLDVLVWMPIVGLIVFGIARIFLALAEDNKERLNYWTLYQGAMCILVLIYLIINYPNGNVS